MTLFNKIFKETKPIIGMIHLKPLPGSPLYEDNIETIFRAACADLDALIEGGINAVIIENFGDIPYAANNDLITYTAFTNLATRLREKCRLPMGVNIQFNNCEAEWAIAYSCGFDFIRVEVFAENRIGPNGIFEASGPALMRLKRKFPKDIAILADVHVKHTFPIAEQPLNFTVDSIIEGGADALICTGITTGKSPDLNDVIEMKRLANQFPVIVGSGINENTIKDFIRVADGAIIGSSIKKDKIVLNPVDKNRVMKLMAALQN